jgi:hypothetical protein
MTSFKVIYNDCYGGFRFSAAFEAEYKKRTGWDLMAEKRLFTNGPRSVRRDSVAIALLEEKGAEWSSGDASFLAIRKIPTLFEPYWSIEDFDGNETVHVDVYEAYADLLHTYMADGNLAALTDGYRRVRAGARALLEERGLLSEKELTSVTVGGAASAATTTGGHGGYGFFDNGDDDTDSLPHD